MKLDLKWKRIGDHRLPVPQRAGPFEAGIDLSVCINVDYQWPHELIGDGIIGEHAVRACVNHPIMFRTGWAVEIPAGWCGLILPRSSIGKAGWDIESSGLIDCTYRGEIMLPMIFRGDYTSTYNRINHGDRVAQMIILPVPEIESTEVTHLSGSNRGAGGFGSTGK